MSTTPADTVALTFEARSKSRLLLRLDSGVDAALIVERGRLLRGGDRVQTVDGRDVEIIALPEGLLEAVSDDPVVLARAAYHLGNRHVAVQVMPGRLRFLDDHVLGEMLKGLGLTVGTVVAPIRAGRGCLRTSARPREPATRRSTQDSRVLAMKAAAFARLLQLASQALPIGGYSHSQGLESAIESGVVADETTLHSWINQILMLSVYSFEIPSFMVLTAAWLADDSACVRALNEEFVASRESAELRAATVQMGFSLRALLRVLPGFPPRTLQVLGDIDEPALPCVWTAAAVAWSFEPRDSALAYVWSWVENQVLVAMKALPLGQSAGQRVLSALGQEIAARLGESLGGLSAEGEDERSNFAPAFAILCAEHETQYSRLFRS